jgi:hypothetical protein
MHMEISHSSEDVVAIQTLVNRLDLRDKIRQRREDWASSTEDFTPDNIWHAMIACLVTTQQRSLPGGRVHQFLSQEPFPLALDACRQRAASIEEFVAETVALGGLRRQNRIAVSCKENFAILIEADGVRLLQERLRALLVSYQQSAESGAPFVRSAERDAARYVASLLHGIGPKQSRNLLLYLGLLRNEVLLDSRTTDWIRRKLAAPSVPFHLPAMALQDEAFYSFVVDAVQSLCDDVGILASDFDAGAFYDEER